MAQWLADEEAAAVAVGGVHRLAARIGFALRLARAESVDQAFLAPLGSALALIGQAVRPTAAASPAVALLRARPEVQDAASFLAALASRGCDGPPSCSGATVSADPLVASDPWARPPAAAAKGKGKGLGKVFKQVREEQFRGQDVQEEAAMVCSKVAVGEFVGKLVGEYIREAKVPESVHGSERAESRESDGKSFKQVEAEQFQEQDSQEETAEEVTAVVVGEVFGRDSGQELEPGFKQESARTGCKEVVGKTFFQGQVSGPPAAAAKGKGKGLGKVFKQVKEEQFWGQDMQEEDAMVCSEVAVGKLVGKIVGEHVGEAKVPDSVQGSARAESREFDGKYFKQVEAEQFQVQDSQKVTAEKVTAVVVGEVCGRDSEQELEPGFTQESARTGCNEVVGKTFVQGQVSEAMVKCTEVAVGELVGAKAASPLKAQAKVLAGHVQGEGGATSGSSCSETIGSCDAEGVDSASDGDDVAGQVQGEGEGGATSGSSCPETLGSCDAEGVDSASDGEDVTETFSRSGLAKMELEFQQATTKGAKRIAKEALRVYKIELEDADFDVMVRVSRADELHRVYED